MNSASSALLSLLGALLLLVPGVAGAQGKCGYLAGQEPAPWISLEAGGGVALPIPLGADARAKSLVAGFGGGVHLNLPSGARIGLIYVRKEFKEENSVFEYGQYNDLLARGSLAAVFGQHVQWDFHLLMGVSFVTVQFMDIDKENPQFEERNGIKEPVGPIKRKQISALTGGLGTRFSYFPIDPVGIFLDLSMLYAYQASLEPEEGAMNLNAIGGLEFHL